jgi:hypothetical protein
MAQQCKTDIRHGATIAHKGYRIAPYGIKMINTISRYILTIKTRQNALKRVRKTIGKTISYRMAWLKKMRAHLSCHPEWIKKRWQCFSLPVKAWQKKIYILL